MTYICKTCRFVTTTKNTYNTHLISKKHKEKNPNEITPPLIMDGSNNTLYECKKCNFSTFVKSAYKKHESSKKHVENTKTCIPCAPNVEKISENKHQIEDPAPNHKDKDKDSIVENHQHCFHMNSEMCEKEKRKRFKHHMGALRLLQELSSGKISENDIAAYMQRHHPGANTSDDDDGDDDDGDDDAASIQDNKDLSSESDETENMYQNVSGFQNQENSDEPETFTFYINGPPESPVPVPHVRHQPYYFDFPPETPAGKLPDPPVDYKLPTFIENRRKTVEANDPEIEARQFNDIRQFIIDFLNGTQDRMGPDAERFRWQLNEITKLFIHNNMNTIQNRPNLPGII